MSEPVQPTIADPTRSSQPLLPDRPARGRRSRLDVALILAAVIAIGGVAFAGGRVTGAQSAAALAAQNCDNGGAGAGGVPGAPEAPNAPGSSPGN